jgi:hypothetical protein
MAPVKFCKRCSIEKLKSDFTPSKRAKDGCQSYCRACYADRRKLGQLADPEKAKAADRKWKKNNAATVRLQKQAYRANNSDKVKLARKLAYEKNRDRELELARIYKSANAARVAEVSADWHRANPYANRANASRRRAVIKCAIPPWANPKAIRSFYKSTDALNMLTGEWHEVDHIVPLQSKFVCGLHCEANLQILTKDENRSKKNVHWPDMWSQSN